MRSKQLSSEFIKMEAIADRSASDLAGIDSHTEHLGKVARRAGIFAWLLAHPDSLVALVLFAGGFLIRLPFQATILNSFDAVNYALALDHFDMRLSQPQAPGYPLYIGLGWLFNLVFQDHRQALVWLSMGGGALVVPAMYLAGQQLFNRRTGWIAGLLTGLAPVVWYMSEIAAPYTLDLAVSALVGALCYRLIRSKGWLPVGLASLAVGLAGALRLQTLIFLYPLLLYALLQRAGSQRRMSEILAGSALAFGVFSMFFIPAVYRSGGLTGFMNTMIGIVPIFRDTSTLVRTTRLARFASNAQTMFSYTLRILGELALPLLFVGGLTQAGSLRFWRSDRLRFLLVWLLPSWVVYFLIWPGNIGTVLVSMPPFFLLAAAGLDHLMNLGGWTKRVSWALLAGILTWSTLAFVALPEEPFGEAYRKLENYAALRRSVESYSGRLALLSQIPSDGTLVFTDNIRILQYYQPQYRTYSLPRFSKEDPNLIRGVVTIEAGEMQTRKDFDAGQLIPAGTERLVFFDTPQDLQISTPLALEQKAERGVAIFVLTIPTGKNVLWTSEGIFLLPVGEGPDSKPGK